MMKYTANTYMPCGDRGQVNINVPFPSHSHVIHLLARFPDPDGELKLAVAFQETCYPSNIYIYTYIYCICTVCILYVYCICTVCVSLLDGELLKLEKKPISKLRNKAESAVALPACSSISEAMTSQSAGIALRSAS